MWIKPSPYDSQSCYIHHNWPWSVIWKVMGLAKLLQVFTCASLRCQLNHWNSKLLHKISSSSTLMLQNEYEPACLVYKRLHGQQDSLMRQTEHTRMNPSLARKCQQHSAVCNSLLTQGNIWWQTGKWPVQETWIKKFSSSQTLCLWTAPQKLLHIVICMQMKHGWHPMANNIKHGSISMKIVSHH